MKTYEKDWGCDMILEDRVSHPEILRFELVFPKLAKPSDEEFQVASAYLVFFIPLNRCNTTGKHVCVWLNHMNFENHQNILNLNHFHFSRKWIFVFPTPCVVYISPFIFLVRISGLFLLPNCRIFAA